MTIFPIVLLIILTTILLLFFMFRDNKITPTKFLLIFLVVGNAFFSYYSLNIFQGYPSREDLAKSKVVAIEMPPDGIYVWAYETRVRNWLDKIFLGETNYIPRSFTIENSEENREKWQDAKSKLSGGYLVQYRMDNAGKYSLEIIDPRQFMRKDNVQQ